MPKCNGGLGFKDMRLFNQALLAHQAWRLIQYPNSLCAQILKAKYYPRGDLIDTVFPTEASPTWRSIQHGLELLKQGIIWRVRSGNKIQIWRDSWIPRAPSLKLGPRKSRSRLIWVSQLMRANRREWDEQIIKACMYPHDAEEVLRIRLSQRQEDDFLAWHYESSGVFTVRSAYKLALEKEHSGKRQEGSSTHPDGWKQDVVQ
jgi:hypothetical protein